MWPWYQWTGLGRGRGRDHSIRTSFITHIIIIYRIVANKHYSYNIIYISRAHKNMTLCNLLTQLERGVVSEPDILV